MNHSWLLEEDQRRAQRALASKDDGLYLVCGWFAMIAFAFVVCCCLLLYNQRWELHTTENMYEEGSLHSCNLEIEKIDNCDLERSNTS